MSASAISRSDSAPATAHREPLHTAAPNLQVRREISTSTSESAPKAPPEKSHSGKVNIKA
jgi:hypothetical protein